jgi:light-regulated signal transduction histidine kinase (bacteriophytochrome)
MVKIRNFDAEFCGKVPLHQTNLIQPHGVLLVVKKDDLTVLQGSENADAVFGKPVTEIVSATLDSILSKDDITSLQSRFRDGVTGKLPFSFSVGASRFLSLVEQYEQYYLLEIEKEPLKNGNETSFVSVFQDVKLGMTAIEACTSTEETCLVAAREFKRLSGFDKVMIYRFDKDWNGDVLAEESEPGMESYLGLKFPASDIPRPARDLYKKSPYRFIPTIDYEGVKLYPVINTLTHSFTDLSASHLRSVAAVHIEYLRNMKVAASMSVRILNDGELWGLVACHHRTPRYLSYEVCSVFELLSGVVSAKISAVQNRDSYAYRSAKQGLQQRLMEAVLSDGGLRSEKEILMQLLDADGVAITGGRHIETAGRTPGRQEIEDLVYWLQANAVAGLYHQPALPSVYEAAEGYADTGSGLLALPVEIDKGDFVLAFRGEAVQTVSWGGNPNEALQFESDGLKYHPRASFKIWQQTVRQTSAPWRAETLEIAESIRNFLVESRLNRKY